MKNNLEKITPHLWFDKEAKEAANFYVSVFGANSKIKNTSVIRDTPSGDCDVLSFDILGQPFMSISAGPLFRFNPSISFMVNCESRSEIDFFWNRLMEGGSVLMPIDKYFFSERYGWVQDKYGLSWQLILSDPSGDWRPRIIPSLLFVDKVYGKAEEAINYYTSIFREAKVGSIYKYGPGQQPDREDAVMFGDFMINGQWFAAMDSAREHNYGFNEAVSFMISCDTQEAIDYYWDKLSAVPEAEQCGWLKDKFGLSWQVVPKDMDEMMTRGTQDQIERVTQAFMKMKKFDIEALREAYAKKVDSSKRKAEREVKL